VAGSCEHGNEPSGSITFWKVLDWCLLKKDSLVSSMELVTMVANA
jgi:hypothetical protein